MADEKAPSAQFEISIDGKPNAHRARLLGAMDEVAFERLVADARDGVSRRTARERKAAGGRGWEPRMPTIIKPQKNNREEAESLTGSERKAAGRPGFKRPWGNEVDEVSKAAPAPGSKRPNPG